jgi:hypothetical protein
MLQFIREFRIGRQQIFAGLLLLVFLGECLWVAHGRRFSDLEFEYIASGFPTAPGQEFRVTSPMTSVMAALPLRTLSLLRKVFPAGVQAVLAIPRPWVVRLPFVIFGLWLGAAIWWVARRLFGDAGGYVALALYCFSPAMVMISSNIGPEIILAWSGFGLIYTAIGVSHTVYAPPRKWVPRIVLLGLSIGICLSAALWALTLVLLALIFMVYLAPGRRRQVIAVLAGASLIGLLILGTFHWLTGSIGLSSKAMVTPHASFQLVRDLGFVFGDAFVGPQSVRSYVLPLLFMAALTVYGSWDRTRYFGNTSPLITSFVVVSAFALVPALHLWEAPLGLSFTFVFIGGVAADLLETGFRRPVALFLAAILAVKAVLAMSLLSGWVHQNPLW